jgi:hypothetical protein
VSERRVLRVLAGDATPEEIAAVVAAVAASAPRPNQARSRPASLWSAPGFAHRNIRARFAPGPDAWRTSFWPR